MNLLPVDRTSNAWRLVVRYASERIAELTEECVSLTTSDEQRRVCAARIDELRSLIQAPEQTKRATEMRETEPRGTY
jgi:hypothetical protein